MRITIACPENLIPDANQFAMVLGLSANDINTFAKVRLQDSGGELYSVVSFPITQSWLDKANAVLIRPLWDGEATIVDMVAVNRAKALFEIDKTAQSDKLIGCIGDNGVEVIKLMGLYSIEEIPLVEEEEE